MQGRRAAWRMHGTLSWPVQWCQSGTCTTLLTSWRWPALQLRGPDAGGRASQQGRACVWGRPGRRHPECQQGRQVRWGQCAGSFISLGTNLDGSTRAQRRDRAAAGALAGIRKHTAGTVQSRRRARTVPERAAAAATLTQPAPAEIPAELQQPYRWPGAAQVPSKPAVSPGLSAGRSRGSPFLRHCWPGCSCVQLIP